MDADAGLLELLHAVLKGSEVVATVDDVSGLGDFFKGQGPIDRRVTATQDDDVLVGILLDIGYVVVDVVKAVSTVNLQWTWLEGTATHSDNQGLGLVATFVSRQEMTSPGSIAIRVSLRQIVVSNGAS